MSGADDTPPATTLYDEDSQLHALDEPLLPDLDTVPPVLSVGVSADSFSHPELVIDPLPRIGQRIDRYIVERRLGEGASAVVYLVRHHLLGTPHALKVLTLLHPTIRARLIQEGRIQSRLHHPGLVSVSDVLSVGERIGLVLEYVEGPSLADWLQRHRPPLDRAERIFSEILDAVETAHEAGVIHRDLKPGNILLEGATLSPKITDFGLARSLAAGPTHTRSGTSMGTPAYMAPEQIRDASRVDERADIFSLGCILYELVCGQRAFRGESLPAIFAAIGRGQYAPPEAVAPELPVRFRRAIRRSLMVDRRDRPESCAALRALLADGGSVRRPLPAAPPRPGASHRAWLQISLRHDDSGQVCFWLDDDTGPVAPPRLGPRMDALQSAHSASFAGLDDALRDRPGAILRASLPPELSEVQVEKLLAGPHGAAVVRTVPSTRPVGTREVPGALRVLVVAPDVPTAAALEPLRRGLPLDSGALEWLDPLIGDDATMAQLLRRLASPPRPHVLYISRQDTPGILPDETGRPVSSGVLAAALSRRLCQQLRLLILDSPLPPAQLPVLAGDGVCAVIGWPEPDTPALQRFLGAISAPGGGDVLDALAAAEAPAGGQPMLWLRGSLSRLFAYSHRRIQPPPPPLLGLSAPHQRVRHRLLSLLSRPDSSVLIGDHGLFSPTPPQVLRRSLAERLGTSPSEPLTQLAQRYELMRSRHELLGLVNGILDEAGADQAHVALLEALARASGPGLFVSMMWLPLLEELLAEAHPDADIISLYPLEPGRTRQLRELFRPAGLEEWRPRQRSPGERLNFQRDYVVLRLFGGQDNTRQGLLGEPSVTESDHLQLLRSIDQLPRQILAFFRRNPVAVLGFSPARWSQRELLRSLTGDLPLAGGSIGVVAPDAAAETRRYWLSSDGPAGGAGRVQLISLADLRAVSGSLVVR